MEPQPSSLHGANLKHIGRNNWWTAVCPSSYRWGHHKLYHIMLYTSPWSRFKLTTSVVIGTDCLGSCKSTYHEITATEAPNVVWSGKYNDVQVVSHRKLILAINLFLWNCFAKRTETWWEAPMEGSVCSVKFPQSRMKGEWHRLSPLRFIEIDQWETRIAYGCHVC
jgi:hypothetical protein